jgi:hypothetical protein
MGIPIAWNGDNSASSRGNLDRPSPMFVLPLIFQNALNDRDSNDHQWSDDSVVFGKLPVMITMIVLWLPCRG